MSSEGGSLLMSLIGHNPDAVKTPRNVDIDKTQETGMDRLRRMYSVDQYGYWSKEFLLITNYSSVSFLASGMIGGVMKSRDAYVNFIENNQATKFANHLEAKRMLQREIYLAFTKGGFRLAWRIGLFTMTFSSLMTSISVYRGQESLVEYLVAGGVTGGIFRMNLGLKGMIAGSVLGTALGALGGSLTLLVLKAAGTSLEEMQEFSKHLWDVRQTMIQEKMKTYMIREYTDMEDRGGDESQFVNLSTDETTD